MSPLLLGHLRDVPITRLLTIPPTAHTHTSRHSRRTTASLLGACGAGARRHCDDARSNAARVERRSFAAAPAADGHRAAAGLAVHAGAEAEQPRERDIYRRVWTARARRASTPTRALDGLRRRASAARRQLSPTALLQQRRLGERAGRRRPLRRRRASEDVEVTIWNRAFRRRTSPPIEVKIKPESKPLLHTAGPTPASLSFELATSQWRRRRASSHLGDGDLSYSVALARALPSAAITATTYLSEAELLATYDGAAAAIAELRERGATVRHGVDASAPLQPRNSTTSSSTCRTSASRSWPTRPRAGAGTAP